MFIASSFQSGGPSARAAGARAVAVLPAAITRLVALGPLPPVRPSPVAIDGIMRVVTPAVGADAFLLTKAARAQRIVAVSRRYALDPVPLLDARVPRGIERQPRGPRRELSGLRARPVPAGLDVFPAASARGAAVLGDRPGAGALPSPDASPTRGGASAPRTPLAPSAVHREGRVSCADTRVSSGSNQLRVIPYSSLVDIFSFIRVLCLDSFMLPSASRK